MSAELTYYFVINQLINSTVSVLSLNEDKLLVGCSYCSELYVYHEGSSHFAKIIISGMLIDAKWTPRGNIIMSTTTEVLDERLVVISKTGEVISQFYEIVTVFNEEQLNRLSSPQFISVSSDDVIYVACWRTTGIYQSKDDGISWNLVFKSAVFEGHYIQAIKVNSYQGNDFWTVVKSNGGSHSLRMYSAERELANDTNKWRTVSLPAEFREGLSLPRYESRLSYDDDVSMFLSDQVHKAVHVFSINGSYLCQLLSLDQTGSEGFVYGLMVDKKNRRLFIGKSYGLIKVFKLNYD